MKHLVMDTSGHSVIEFDKTEVKIANEKFGELVERGFTPATRKHGEVEYRVIRRPEDQEDETLFIPQMRGG